MSKETDNNWKNKALIRSKEIKSLNKEIVRQTKRATDWRSAALTLCKVAVNKDLIIKDLSRETPSVSAAVSPAKVGGYRYDSRLIWLCVSLYKSGLSLRQVQLVVAIISYYIGKTIKAPSHSIISIWVHKVGLSELKEGLKKFEQSIEDITTCLSSVCRQFKGKIAYVTSDNGSNLLCTYKDQGLSLIIRPMRIRHSLF
jgi:hypothetical protein